ncbi:MAG: tryptophan 2,3-dioxygenase [Bacteroidia bacterium]|nr:tryptophan 2,3-dioxygenase [Bacteroidia bacterium]
MELKPEIIDRLKKLDEKYEAMGQSLTSYLDGLLYADYLTYWDYVHLDTLLSLQTPKTGIPDEQIFIMYHQITELYFKLSLHEFEQLAQEKSSNKNLLLKCVTRVNRYFNALIDSFDIMVDGMEPDQFHKFRMSLLPASGFQSGQYRMIEIYCTEFINLVQYESRKIFSGTITDEAIEKMYSFIYWKTGATELATGKKTLTLKQFELKYSKQLIELAKQCKSINLLSYYKLLSETDRNDTKVIEAFKLLDLNINVNWPLSHYKSAVRYLHKNPEDIAATGGTNWQKYLPPRFQKRIFFPELWSAEEIDNWGKTWVRNVVFGK